MTSDNDDSLTATAAPFQTQLLKGYLSPQEQERRLQGARCLREQRISLPLLSRSGEGLEESRRLLADVVRQLREGVAFRPLILRAPIGAGSNAVTRISPVENALDLVVPELSWLLFGPL